MGHRRNFVNMFCFVWWCMIIREDHCQKKQCRSFAYLPWLPSVLPTPISWPRTPWLVEPLYFRSVHMAHSSWGNRKRLLAGTKKKVLRCTTLRQWPKDPHTFSSPSKNNTQHSIQIMNFLFVCWNPFSHSPPPLCASSILPETLWFALLKRRYRRL